MQSPGRPLEIFTAEQGSGLEANPLGLRTYLIPTNGVRLHAAVEGEGELIILIHGFPQCWYIWRHQVAALAQAGFRVCAPDQRGYGNSDLPRGVEDYDILKASADIIGLADELGAETFTVVGQDWGCFTAWHVALLYPHRIRGVLGFSVPYVPGILRNWVEPSSYRDEFWYVRYFLQPGLAEMELEQDLSRFLMWFWYGASGGNDVDVTSISSGGPRERRLLDGLGETPIAVPGCSQADLDYCIRLYRRSGLRGPINHYRNLARLRDLTPWLEEAKILVPAMFAYGDEEPMARRSASFDESLDKPPLQQQDEYFSDLMGKMCIPNAGHWPMIEQPGAVNDLIIDFMSKLRTREASRPPTTPSAVR